MSTVKEMSSMAINNDLILGSQPVTCNLRANFFNSSCLSKKVYTNSTDPDQTASGRGMILFLGCQPVTCNMILLWKNTMIDVQNLNSFCLSKQGRQTVQTQIRVLLKKQSDRGIPCLLYILTSILWIPALITYLKTETEGCSIFFKFQNIYHV